MNGGSKKGVLVNYMTGRRLQDSEIAGIMLVDIYYEEVLPMEYCVLTKSLRCPQFKKELKFEIAPIPSAFRGKFVQDGYASSSEYGLMTHDDDNALGHAFMILDRLRHENSSSNRRHCRVLLIDDLQNLLHCYSYGLTVRREETKALISSMLAVKGCARPLASSILSYYESCRKDITEEHYINYSNERYALDFVDLYVKAADEALFLDRDVDLAIQFYHLAGLYWGDPSSFTTRSTAGRWQLAERRFIGILHNSNEGIRINKSVSNDILLALERVTKAFGAGDDNTQIVELANEGFAAYDQALEKAGNDRPLLRKLLIIAWALKKFSLLSALCCLKEEPLETITALAPNVKDAILTMRLPDAPTYPLRNYTTTHMHSRYVDATKELLCFACTIDIARKLQNALRITKPGQDMAYYTSLDTLMYMLPARCRDKRDVGKLSVMNLAYMNDPNEGRILKKYLLSGHASGNHDTRKDATYPFVFIKCFTSRVDDLPMWEIYGDHARGVCIVIDWPTTLDTAAQATPLYRVCYLTKFGDTYTLDDDSNQQLEHREKIREWLKGLRAIRSELVDGRSGWFFDSLLEGIAYLFKDSSYHYEQEVRILYVFSEASDQFRYTSGEYPLLFVQSEFPVAIQEIVIGPKFPEPARRMPYIQEQIEHMCRINDTPYPKLTFSDIEYK